MLLVLGLPSMFFTHVAVRFFGGIHPESVSSSGSGHVMWYLFLLAGLLELLAGIGIGVLDWRRLSKKEAGRMARQVP